jgi:hypothetical protein
MEEDPPHQTDRLLSSESRLDAYLKAKAVVVFAEAIVDREYPYVTCSMWGVIPTNELFVRLSNGSASFVDCVPSPLEVPLMSQRVQGMFEEDAHAAGELADRLWSRHNSVLIRGR